MHQWDHQQQVQEDFRHGLQQVLDPLWNYAHARFTLSTLLVSCFSSPFVCYMERRTKYPGFGKLVSQSRSEFVALYKIMHAKTPKKLTCRVRQGSIFHLRAGSVRGVLLPKQQGRNEEHNTHEPLSNFIELIPELEQSKASLLALHVPSNFSFDLFRLCGLSAMCPLQLFRSEVRSQTSQKGDLKKIWHLYNFDVQKIAPVRRVPSLLFSLFSSLLFSSLLSLSLSLFPFLSPLFLSSSLLFSRLFLLFFSSLSPLGKRIVLVKLKERRKNPLSFFAKR